jgi:hypothetical protein
LGTLGGLLPDSDLVIYNTLQQPLALNPDIHHHTWPTHTIPFYLIPGGLMALWTHKWARIKFQYQQVGQTGWHYGEMVISTDHDGPGLRHTCGIG